MTTIKLMFEDTIEQCCIDLKKTTKPFRDWVRTQRFKNDEIRRNKISQIAHSALDFDYIEILQTAKT